MFYLDSSALVKRYIRERGSRRLQARLASGDRLFTSALSFAEVLAALGRVYRERRLSERQFKRLRERFLSDWIFSLNILALDSSTMIAIPNLIAQYPLKGADAVHLAAAIWLRDKTSLDREFAANDASLHFVVSDKALANAAKKVGIAVFNPEAEP